MHATTGGPITNTTSQVTGTGVPPGGPASATLTVTAQAVPTLSAWMLVAFAIAIATLATIRLKAL
jgi:hypothetical protein